MALGAAIAMLALVACGSSDSTARVAFDPEVGLDGVVECLTGNGWTEIGKSTGTSGTAYTVDSDSGTSVLLSTNTAAESPTGDSTTFTIASTDPDGGSMSVETFIGSLADSERTQINECAGG